MFIARINCFSYTLSKLSKTFTLTAQGGGHVKYSYSPAFNFIQLTLATGKSDSNVLHLLSPEKICILCPVLDKALTRLRIN